MYSGSKSCDSVVEPLSDGEHPPINKDSATKQHIAYLIDFNVVSSLFDLLNIVELPGLIEIGFGRAVPTKK